MTSTNIQKRCAIIGSKGFLGRHVEKYLLEKYGIVADSYDVIDEDAPNYQKIDLTQKETLTKINLDLDYIFLFSGLTGTYVGFDKYESFLNVNDLGLANLLDTIRQSPYRPKVIYPSSRLVYKGADMPLTEEAEKECRSIYAVSKLACEGLLQAYYYSFDIPYTIFRICIPYGNFFSKEYSFGTIGFFIKQAKKGQNITLYGGGINKRTFTHIEDVCFQMIEGAFNPCSEGNTYNIGGETLTLREAAEIIAKKFGVEIADIPWPERDLRIESSHTYFSNEKIDKILPPFNIKKMEVYSNEL